jgi:hypothetical protein
MAAGFLSHVLPDQPKPLRASRALAFGLTVAIALAGYLAWRHHENKARAAAANSAAIEQRSALASESAFRSAAARTIEKIDAINARASDDAYESSFGRAQLSVGDLAALASTSAEQKKAAAIREYLGQISVCRMAARVDASHYGDCVTKELALRTVAIGPEGQNTP